MWRTVCGHADRLQVDKHLLWLHFLLLLLLLLVLLFHLLFLLYLLRPLYLLCSDRNLVEHDFKILLPSPRHPTCTKRRLLAGTSPCSFACSIPSASSVGPSRGSAWLPHVEIFEERALLDGAPVCVTKNRCQHVSVLHLFPTSEPV